MHHTGVGHFHHCTQNHTLDLVSELAELIPRLRSSSPERGGGHAPEPWDRRAALLTVTNPSPAAPSGDRAPTITHPTHIAQQHACSRTNPSQCFSSVVTIRFISQINITNKIYKQSISRSSGLPTHTQPVCPYILTFLPSYSYHHSYF